jgi:hypothetical protein
MTNAAELLAACEAHHPAEPQRAENHMTAWQSKLILWTAVILSAFAHRLSAHVAAAWLGTVQWWRTNTTGR